MSICTFTLRGGMGNGSGTGVSVGVVLLPVLDFILHMTWHIISEGGRSIILNYYLVFLAI